MAYPIPHLVDIDGGRGPGCIRAGFVSLSFDLFIVGAGGDEGAVVKGSDR